MQVKLAVTLYSWEIRDLKVIRLMRSIWTFVKLKIPSGGPARFSHIKGRVYSLFKQAASLRKLLNCLPIFPPIYRFICRAHRRCTALQCNKSEHRWKHASLAKTHISIVPSSSTSEVVSQHDARTAPKESYIKLMTACEATIKTDWWLGIKSSVFPQGWNKWQGATKRSTSHRVWSPRTIHIITLQTFNF